MLGHSRNQYLLKQTNQEIAVLKAALNKYPHNTAYRREYDLEAKAADPRKASLCCVRAQPRHYPINAKHKTKLILG